MICKICKNYFYFELRFEDIFNHSLVCNDCENKYPKRLNVAVIPIKNHLIYYYYFVLEEPEIFVDYFNTYFYLIYQIIILKPNFTIIFLDEENVMLVKKLLPLLNFNSSIILFSFYFIELENI